MLASFISSWIEGEPGALAFLGAGVRDATERRRQVERAASRTISPSLARALRAQDATLPESSARRQHIDALASGGVAAVVTGQQVGLFLGPLFTLYKAATTIVLARALSAETGVRCVPVFWLQTEDHDYLEIHHCHLPPTASEPGSAPVRVSLPDDDGRMSVAHRRLGPGVVGALAALERELGALPCARELLALMHLHHSAERSPADAFAATLATVFSDEGLVLLDPRRVDTAPLLMPLIGPLLRRSIAQWRPIEAALVERGHALEAAGFEAQVRVRPRSPLAFFHEGSAEGPRQRLVRAPDDASWRLGDRRISDEELDHVEPLRLSSSALLRPVIQDALLPTAAYVGGPGELAYFAQLGPLYRHFEVAQPMAVLRARLRLVEPTARSLLARLGAEGPPFLPVDVERPRDELLALAAMRRGLTDTPEPQAWRASLLDGADRAFDELEPVARSLDANLVDPVRRTRDTLHRAVDRLVERYERARNARDLVTVERIDRLRAMLAPDGVPQERFYGLPYFASRHGLSALKEAVLRAIHPFDTAIVDLDL